MQKFILRRFESKKYFCKKIKLRKNYGIFRGVIFSRCNKYVHQELNINVLVRSTDPVLQRSTNTSNVFKYTRTHRSSAFYERFVLIAYQNTPFQCVLRTFRSYSVLERTVLVYFTNFSFLYIRNYLEAFQYIINMKRS